MADIGKVMGVNAADIASIMGVAAYNIGSFMGADLPEQEISGWAGVTGVQFGGNHYYSSGNVTYGAQIQYNTIGSASTAGDFGDIASGGRENSNGVGVGVSAARAVLHSGPKSGDYFNDDTDYITVASTGNTNDFGDAVEETHNGATMSNGTLMFIGAGSGPVAPYKIAHMAQRAIASTGDFTDAGNLLAAQTVASVSGNTRGGMMGGYHNPVSAAVYRDDVEYITFDTSANSIAFGTLTAPSTCLLGIANISRWIVNHNYVPSASPAHVFYLDYWTVASGGSAQDFGDDVLSGYQAGTSNGTRGEIWGGYRDAASVAGTHQNTTGREEIRYITMASTGDSQDTGALMHENYEDYNGTSGLMVGALINNSSGSGT